MFVGHAAVALAARPILPGQSLGTLFAAAFWIDLVWPVMLLTGLEQVRVDPGNTAFTPLAFVSYPWTHSLLLVVGWALLVAWVTLRGHTRPRRVFGLLGLIVVSHWMLDAVSHRPDLPLMPGTGPMVGLGLWNSVPATLLVEGTLFAAGIALYVRSTAARDRVGRWALWTLLIVMTGIWLSQPFAVPPPSARAVGLGALSAWLLPLWAHWADSHRVLGIARQRREEDRRN